MNETGTKALFYGVVTPLAVVLRPLWRSRLVLGRHERETYWRTRSDVVDAKSLRSQR